MAWEGKSITNLHKRDDCPDKTDRGREHRHKKRRKEWIQSLAQLDRYGNHRMWMWMVKECVMRRKKK
jgi:hypothetical protein